MATAKAARGSQPPLRRPVRTENAFSPHRVTVAAHAELAPALPRGGRPNCRTPPEALDEAGTREIVEKVRSSLPATVL